MTPEIRRAAVRMAAKTALVFSLGCSGGGKSQTTTTTGNEGGTPAPAAETCEAYLDRLGTADMTKLADDDPLKGNSLVYGAFADVAARSAPRTTECCTSELVASGSGAKHRWECCSALPAVPAEAEGSACTPWGPPCPPEMIV